MRIFSHAAALVLATAIAAGAGIERASAAVITFDGVASGTQIDSLYAASGVTFTSLASASGHAYAVGLIGAPSNNGVSLHSADPTFAAEEGAVEAHFSALQKTVSIDAQLIEALESLGRPQKRPFFQAFDIGGNYLSTAYYDATVVPVGAVSGPWETLTISDATADIAFVRFSSQNNWAGLNCDPTLGGGVPGGCPDRMYGGIYGQFDNLAFGTGGGGGIPEPGTLGLVGIALAGFAWRRTQEKT
jgi:hypothetical protein